MACNAAESWYANLDDFSYAFIWCEQPQVVARPATRYRSAVPAQPARAEVPAVAADPENGIEGVPFQPARLAQPAQPEVPDLPKILAEPAVLENQNMSVYLLQEFQEVASLEVAEQEFIPFRTQRANQSCREFCFKLLTALPKYHEVKFTEELREGEAYAATRDRELLSVARSGCIKIFKDYIERLEIANPNAVATFAQFQEAAKTFETKTVEGQKHYNNAKPGPEVKHAVMASLVEVGNPVTVGAEHSSPLQSSNDSQVPSPQHFPDGYYHSERRESRQAPAHNYVFQAVSAAGHTTQRQGAVPKRNQNSRTGSSRQTQNSKTSNNQRQTGGARTYVDSQYPDYWKTTDPPQPNPDGHLLCYYCGVPSHKRGWCGYLWEDINKNPPINRAFHPQRGHLPPRSAKSKQRAAAAASQQMYPMASAPAYYTVPMPQQPPLQYFPVQPSVVWQPPRPPTNAPTQFRYTQAQPPLAWQPYAPPVASPTYTPSVVPGSQAQALPSQQPPAVTYAGQAASASRQVMQGPPSPRPSTSWAEQVEQESAHQPRASSHASASVPSGHPNPVNSVWHASSDNSSMEFHNNYYQ